MTILNKKLEQHLNILSDNNSANQDKKLLITTHVKSNNIIK
jgi:hypothetical protein